ncbi:NACHT domain-containing protein [Pedobacter namyangjuensis]|uniref:NACHT domain-containing protein n=1 Tax=Pedobacter namyangjuensis TaxID=600626 RepID=UPI000DE30AD3|nr:hypothetical protein [Pedobacter namyangjuensis]
MNNKRILYWFNDLRPIYKGIIMILFLLAVGTLYYSFSNNHIGGIFLTTSVAICLFLTKNFWTPKEYRKPLLTYFSVGGFWLAAVSLVTSLEKIEPIIKPIVIAVNPMVINLSKKYSYFSAVEVNVDLIIALLLIILIIIVFIVNYVFRKNTIVIPHPNPLQDDLKDLDMKGKMKAISQSLSTELLKIDKETNWSDYYFTPIDAEVEIISNNRKEKRITDLMNALKKNKRARAFLILGDPGSGKSVALRKLAKEMLDETADTGRVALYINLKEWEPDIPWTEKNRPTENDVYHFVLKNIKGKLDLFGNNFMDSYFEKMHSQGRFFYIIDSFDEMPSVLDISESSWLISDLSHAIYKFITAGVEGRGIVASRIFRRPNKYFSASVTLELRPLSDYKIKENLEKSDAFSESVMHRLFHTRADLLPLASNPFMSALLINFVKSNNGNLPSIRAELFRNYIDNRLDAANEKIGQLKLSKSSVIEFAIEIAHYIFHRHKSGLEISMKDLMKKFDRIPYNIEHIVQVLEYAKIAKLGKGNGAMFSFVHRRFNEYFVVQKMLLSDTQINLESIPSDSRYRDALVLYCEVAPMENAIAIADFCWNFIRKMETKHLKLNNENNVKVIFCLRFLKEAFMMRLECIEHFRKELSAFILFQMSSKNLLLRKIIVENSSITETSVLQKTILIAFNTSNPLIQEAGFKAGRYLERTDEVLNRSIIKYILRSDFIDFFVRRKELSFALKLTPTFEKVYYQYKWLLFERKLLLAGIILSFFSYLTFFALLVCFTYYKILKFINYYIVNTIYIWDDDNLVENEIVVEDADNKRLIGFRNINAELLLRCSFVIALIALPIVGSIKYHGREIPPDVWYNGFNSFKTYFLYTICLLVCPKMELILLLKSYRIPFRRLKTLVTITIFGALFLIATYVALSKLDKMILETIAKTIFLLPAAVVLWRFCSRYRKDIRLLKTTRYFETMDRRSIAENLSKLFYRDNRMKYIVLVSQNAKKVTGNWPGDIIPNYHDDASSSLLTLEEKWLNLEG